MLLALPQWLYADTAEAPGDSLSFSLLTYSPGSDIYELEGHAELRVRIGDEVDQTISWGLFDFDSPNFVYRFVKGETDYMAGAAPTAWRLERSRLEGRGVTEQELVLTPEEATRLLALVEDNLRPENRVYRYNYVKDNCATRPLDLVEAALGDTLALGRPSSTLDGVTTFRQAMRRYHSAYPWYQFGIDLALGSGIDRAEQPRAMAFAPEALTAMIAGATRSDGVTPIALPAVTLVEGRAEGGPQAPTPWLFTPVAVGWALFALGAVLTVSDLRRRKESRWFDSAFFGVVGLTGLVVAFLVFCSTHEAVCPNWVILWVNPLALAVAAGIWLKKAKRIVICLQIVNFASILALLAVWAAGVQSLNPAFLPLMLLELTRIASYLKLNRWS